MWCEYSCFQAAVRALRNASFAFIQLIGVKLDAFVAMLTAACDVAWRRFAHGCLVKENLSSCRAPRAAIAENVAPTTRPIAPPGLKRARPGIGGQKFNAKTQRRKAAKPQRR